jgi:hypothetical protein
MSEWEVDQAAHRAFTASIPKDLPVEQKLILTTLFVCAEGEDRPITEPHAELAALAGLELSVYFTGLLKLRYVGFVTDDGQSLRINRTAIHRTEPANKNEKSKQIRGRSSGST